jgi:hypothetical protein
MAKKETALLQSLDWLVHGIRALARARSSPKVRSGQGKRLKYKQESAFLWSSLLLLGGLFVGLDIEKPRPIAFRVTIHPGDGAVCEFEPVGGLAHALVHYNGFYCLSNKRAVVAHFWRIFLRHNYLSLFGALEEHLRAVPHLTAV